MKSKEGLNALKEAVEALNEKFHELTDEELEQVTGGAAATKATAEDVIETSVRKVESEVVQNPR